jgi:LmbE family N-acetylglucosaminyl deacetylase
MKPVLLPRPILLSPHDDDFALFAAFSCIMHRPRVVVVFDSHFQDRFGITTIQRAKETDEALRELGVGPAARLHLSDTTGASPSEITQKLLTVCHLDLAELVATAVFAPAYEVNGHDQHNAVAEAVKLAGVQEVISYATYTRVAGPEGKTVTQNEVGFSPDWVSQKLLALSVFKSQFWPATGCVEHFIGRSLREYYLP